MAFRLPIIFYKFQNYLLSIQGIDHAGSNPLFRIGIDNFSNIHHCRKIAVFKFLGGNRIFSECFLNSNINKLSKHKNI